MHERLFKSAYHAYEALRSAQPQHALLALAPLNRSEHDTYMITVSPGFLERYTVSGIENQIRAYMSDLETALTHVLV